MNIIITGASRGIGKAIAEAFAEDKQGHTILLCSRNQRNLELFSRELQGRFPRTSIRYKTCDISNKEGAAEFTDWVFSTVAKVDILINNVGSFIPGSISEEPDDALERMLAVNLYSAYYVTKAILPMMKAENNGHVFTLCSVASIQAYPNGGAYSISKFALLGFTKNLREELKPYGIKVTAVISGAVYTDSWKDSGVPASRMMEASDISKMIYTITHLSPQATVEEIVIRPQLGDI